MSDKNNDDFIELIEHYHIGQDGKVDHRVVTVGSIRVERHVDGNVAIEATHRGGIIRVGGTGVSQVVVEKADLDDLIAALVKIRG